MKLVHQIEGERVKCVSFVFNNRFVGEGSKLVEVFHRKLIELCSNIVKLSVKAFLCCLVSHGH